MDAVWRVGGLEVPEVEYRSMEEREAHSATSRRIRRLGFNPEFMTPEEQGELLAIHSNLARIEEEEGDSSRPRSPDADDPVRSPPRGDRPTSIDSSPG